jgi:hypothetical protein
MTTVPCVYLGAVAESVLPPVSSTSPEAERAVFSAILVELRKQAAWDTPAEARVPSAATSTDALSIVRVPDAEPTADSQPPASNTVLVQVCARAITGLQHNS